MSNHFWWSGNPAYARHLVNFEGGAPSIVLAGNSESSNSYSSDSSTNTGIHYGIARQYQPSVWGGIFGTPASGDRGTYNFLAASNSVPGVTLSLVNPGAALPGGLGAGLTPSPAACMSSTGPIADNAINWQGYMHAIATVASVYPQSWTANGEALTARTIFLKHDAAMPLKLHAQRTMFSSTISTTTPTMTAVTPAIGYQDQSLGSSVASGDGRAGILAYNADSADETDTVGVILGVGIFRANGLRICPLGLGGATVQDLTSDTFSTTQAWAEWLIATGATGMRVQVGQNNAPDATNLSNGNYQSFKTAVNAFLTKMRAAFALAGVTSPWFHLVNPWKSGYSDFVHGMMGQAMFEIGNERTDTLFYDLFARAGATTADTVGGGDDVHLSLAGNDRLMALEWADLRTIARWDTRSSRKARRSTGPTVQRPGLSI